MDCGHPKVPNKYYMEMAWHIRAIAYMLSCVKMQKKIINLFCYHFKFNYTVVYLYYFPQLHRGYT